VRIYFMKYQAE